MGVMRFLVDPAEVLADWPEAHQAYISSIDQSIWPTRVELDGNELRCRRQHSDSGKLHVAWPVENCGRPVLTTASLPERAQPYLLAVELARGKIVQLRNQAAAWQQAGMSIPKDFAALNREAHQHFARAAARQDNPRSASLAAQEALNRACLAGDLLARSYTRQRLESRHRQYPNLPTALGCGLNQGWLPSDDVPLLTAFNAVAVPVEWRQIEATEGAYRWEEIDAQVEWALSHKLLTRAGPLIDLSADGLPEWLWQWEQDYWNLESFVCDFVETAVRRFLGRIRVWEIAARVNTGGALALSEEQRLTVVARALEVARKVDVESQFLIRIDQPWGEYQARGQHKLSPLHCADALLRAGLPISGLNLEIALSYSPGGTASRDMLEFSRLIDQWSALSIPLQITLAVPSGRGVDPQLTSDLEVGRDSWRLPWSPTAQAEWIDTYLPLLMAKPSVVAIFWSHYGDHLPHRFPHAGLVDTQGQPNPGLHKIQKYRKTYWK